MSYSYSYSSSGGSDFDNKPMVFSTTTTGGAGGDFDDFDAKFREMGFGGDMGGFGDTGGSKKTVTYSSSDSSMPSNRYQVGWKQPDQVDRKKTTRVSRIASQNFKEIRDHCIKEGGLWEDPDFPANDKSVYYSYTPSQSFEWKRPKDIASEPRMIVGGASRFDVCQGDLGNCWFLAAVASLCASGNKSGGNKELLTRVVCPDNSFIENYGGVVHFKIWQYGRWVDVVIDDRLPTLDGRLVFMHSADPNEFWSALLEKAYAKLNGSYEALSAGAAAEAMEDFTGGVVEVYDFKKGIPKNLYNVMMKAYNRCSLMGCTIDATNAAIESVLPNGLVIGHAYSVTAVQKLTVRGQEYKLLRVRNPWGNQYEWKGAWGDNSGEMQALSASQKQKLGITSEADGEFWMDYNDFIGNYHKLEICNLSPDPLTEDIAKQSKATSWNMSMEEGSWRRKVNAGGCRNFLDTFWTNPQYRIEIVDPDPGDDDDMGSIIIALMQKERRKKKAAEGVGYLTLGYSIYKLPDPNCGPLDLNFFKFNAAASRSPTFSNMREIAGRHKLAPGHYVIIPSTFKANEEGEFIVRIFSEEANKSGELDEPTGIMPDEDEKPSKPELAVSEADSRRRRQRARQVTEDDVTEERTARVVFRKNSGEDLEVDAYELKTLLNNLYMAEFKFDGFSLETARSMVAMMDIDRSGKLGYDEFKVLWDELRMWKKIFREFDQDGSGNLNSFELRQALNSAGIRVSNSTFNALVMRYSDQEGRIEFDDFIQCALRLKTMFDTWKEMAGGGAGPAVFPLDAFIQTTMYS